MISATEIKLIEELVIQVQLIRGSVDINDPHDLSAATLDLTSAVWHGVDGIFDVLRSEDRVAAMIYRDEDELIPVEDFEFRIFRKNFESDDELRGFFEDLRDFVQGDECVPFHGGILVAISNIPDHLNDEELIESLNREPFKSGIPVTVVSALLNRD